MNELLKWAMMYVHECSFSVIPLKGDKKPLIKWEEFQTRRPSDKELYEWFSTGGVMIGIVTGKISNLSVIDVDNQDGDKLFNEIVKEGFQAPRASTPRGGYHVYCNYSEGLRNTARIGGGIDIRSDGGYVVAAPSTNEDGKHYKWVQGLNIRRPSVPQEFLDYKELITEMGEEDTGDMFTEGRRDNDLFHAANCLVKGGMEYEQVASVVKILAENCDPPFPKKEVAFKVQSAVQRGIRRERNLSQEVKDWVMSSSGVFLSSEVARCLQLTSRDELKSLSKILSRLVDDGDIRRHGERAGMFRKIEKDFRIMNWQDASISPIAIKYPLGLEDVFCTYAKNMIIFAGIKDSGKTAFMLDFVKKNQNKFKINYYTNEMGDEELKIRLLAHRDIKIHEWKFKAYEVGGAWGDLVQPDEITVIDYIEINDSFWEIGDILKQIHERLNKGIAVIGIQKAKSTEKNQVELGRGKEFSLQRPRMYMTLDSGVAKIISAKNRVPGSCNPVGMVRSYSIVDGWKIVCQNDWHFPTFVPRGAR